jgi:hypothetical protein
MPAVIDLETLALKTTTAMTQLAVGTLVVAGCVKHCKLLHYCRLIPAPAPHAAQQQTHQPTRLWATAHSSLMAHHAGHDGSTL